MKKSDEPPEGELLSRPSGEQAKLVGGALAVLVLWIYSGVRNQPGLEWLPETTGEVGAALSVLFIAAAATIARWSRAS